MKKQSYALSQLVHVALIGFLSFLTLTLILALFATLAHSAEVTLAWDPNTEPGLAGYKVYYKTASSGPPYNGTGATEGDSPIDVGNLTEFTLHGLTDGVPYFFVATAYDTGGLESNYSEEVVYNQTGNDPPVANAGPDQTVGEREQVYLDGSDSSDPDGDPLTFQWEQAAGILVELSDATIADPTFTAPTGLTQNEILTFQLVVNDGELSSVPDSVTITVEADQPMNYPPVANAGPDQIVDEGTTVILDGSSSTDPDDGIVSYLWTQTAGTSVALSDPTSATPSFSAPDVGPSGTLLTFQLTVTDKGGLQSTDTMTVNVSWVNVAPTADAGPDQTVDEGITVTLDASNSTDPDDGIVSYLWIQTSGTSVTISDSTAIQPTFTAPDVGADGESLTFQLTVTDKGGLQSTDTMTVNVSWVNVAPTADAGPDQTVDEGITVTLDASNSTDPDDGIVSYLWIQTSGTSVTISDSTAIQPTFTAPDVGADGESLTFQLTVTDKGGLQSSDTCIVDVSSSLKIEAGEVIVDHNWTRVEFNEPFIDPVVVAKPLSFSDDDPAVVRISNVESTGFEIRLQEWDYLDGTHAAETVGYIVMEARSYIMGDRKMVEAGRFETDSTNTFVTVTFSQPFEVVPVVVTAVSSINGPDAVTTRVRNITTTGFDFRMQEQEANSQSHAAETISYIAWEPSSGTVAGFTFEVDKTEDVMTHQFQTISFLETFTNIPVFLADMQTTDGGDTANLRWKNKDFSGIDVQIDEEQSRNTETNHTTEVVGYMVFAMTNGDVDTDTDGDGITDSDEINVYGTHPIKVDTDGDHINDADEVEFWGSDWNVDYDNDGIINLLDPDSDNDGFLDGLEIGYGLDPSDPNSRPLFPYMQVGEASVDHNWTLVELSEPFIDPVVVAKPLSCTGDDPAVVRIHNVDESSFEIRVQEWDYLDGTHAAETVGYIVMERGSYTLADGSMVEAGRFETDSTNTFVTVTFGQPFEVVPVVVTAVSSINEPDAVTTRVRNITTTGFDFRMQEQEANSQSHAAETISYIAWEPSSGTAGGFTFEVDKTEDVIKHQFQTISFLETFTNIPVFLADMQTTDGGDTANLRWKNKDFSGIDVQIDEEQSRNTETNHITEVVGYMVFDITH